MSRIAIIGTGSIGTALGGALAQAGHDVTFGSRHPDDQVGVDGTRTADMDSALDGAEVIVVAIPGPSVEEFAGAYGTALAGTLVIDASNKMGVPVANSRMAFEELAPGARYARAFNCLGVELLEDPLFGNEPADMFFSCIDGDRATVEGLVGDVGLRPVYVGDDPAVVDGVFRLWIALAIGQQRGRQLAFRVLER